MLSFAVQPPMSVAMEWSAECHLFFMLIMASRAVDGVSLGILNSTLSILSAAA